MKLMRKYYRDKTPGKRYYVYGNPQHVIAVLLEVDVLKIHDDSDQADAEIIKVVYQSRAGGFGEYQEGNLIVIAFYHLPDSPQSAKKELLRLFLDDVGQ